MTSTTYFDEAREALERASHSIRAFLGMLQLAFKDASEPVNLTLFVEAWLRAHGELYWQAFHVACYEGVATDLFLISDPETGRAFLVFRDLRDDNEVVWEQAEMDESLYTFIAGCTRPVIVLDRISQERHGRSWLDLTMNCEQIEGTEDPFALESSS